MVPKLKNFKLAKSIVWRVAADAVFVNLSLAATLLLRFLARILSEPVPAQPEQIARTFMEFYQIGAPVLTFLLVAVFSGFGVYTRTRFYARKHKAFVLFQAITASYLLFLFALYLLFPAMARIPRSVFLLSYLLTLALSGGTRVLKHFASDRYEWIERREQTGREIRRVLVVGGAGYIGSVLVRQLLERGYQVRVLDAIVFGSQSLDGVATHPDLEIVEGDLRHVEVLVRAVKGCDAVVHLGGLVGDSACALNAESTREINTLATKLLLQICRGYGVNRLLFASSCAVYGASDHLMDERSALNPVSLYAQSKVDAEKVVLEARSSDFVPVVLRLGTAFGHSHRPRFDLVVNLLVAKAWKDKKITVYNKDQWRPFVHVHDIARAFCLCLVAPAELVSGEIFNIGSYRLNLSLGQVAEKIQALIPDTDVEYIETADRRNYRVSFDKVHSYLSFSCEKTIEDGIREIVAYLEREPVELLAEPVFDNAKTLREVSGAWLAQKFDLPLARVVEGPAATKAPGQASD